MVNEPVQVVTNPERLRGPREAGKPASAGTDFFAGDDSGFARHRDALAAQLEALLELCSAAAWVQQYGGLLHIKVTMRPRAIAKSHRPQKALFTSARSPHVATARIGEPIFAVTPTSLRALISAVKKAPEAVPWKPDSQTGELSPRPNRVRCEVSAIQSVTAWSAGERRMFSAEEAIEWMAQPSVGSHYIVKLFPSSNEASTVVREAGNVAARSLQTILDKMPVAGNAFGSLGTGRQRYLRLRPVEGGGGQALSLGLTAPAIGAWLDIDGDLSRDVIAHQGLLEALDSNPLVLSVELPPRLSARREQNGEPEVFSFPADLNRSPSQGIVGVVDGGISTVVDRWVADRHDFLDQDDIDAAHGTFIAGLLAAGASLNPFTLADAGDGCAVVDVALLPADPANSGEPFDFYYPNGASDFFDELDSAVGDFRRVHNVRIFNFSLNFTSPTDLYKYSFAAEQMDQIARRHDVIFVISAGNLEPAEQRREWPRSENEAVAVLVGEVGTTITEPAESIFNISVSALNPPGLDTSVPWALTKYSRRGPGLRGAVKPDFAHIGGSGTPSADRGTGLNSLDADAESITGAGTSYAAPLVATQLARLREMIAGEPSRETLIGLAVHFAEMPKVMKHKAILPAARDLAGFGVIPTAEKILDRPDSEITLLFSGTVMPKEQHRLVFSWPESLANEAGSCRGYARLTLVARPVVAYEHGDERIRVNIDATLRQEGEDESFASALHPVNRPRGSRIPKSEPDLLEAQKWQVVKCFETANMRGRGKSSNWEFMVNYLSRAEEDLPSEGVEFAAILTISDPAGEAPVFQQVRQQLVSLGIQTVGIRTSVQTRART